MSTLTLDERIQRAESRVKLALMKVGNQRHAPECDCDPCAELAEREGDLLALRESAEREQRRQVDRSRLLGEAIRERGNEARQAALRRGDDALKAYLAGPDVPEVRMTCGPVGIAVRFASADGHTLSMFTEAVRKAVLLVQTSARDRAHAVRIAAMEGKALLPMDAEGIARAFRGALQYHVDRGLVRVTVKKR